MRGWIRLWALYEFDSDWERNGGGKKEGIKKVVTKWQWARGKEQLFQHQVTAGVFKFGKWVTTGWRREVKAVVRWEEQGYLLQTWREHDWREEWLALLAGTGAGAAEFFKLFFPFEIHLLMILPVIKVTTLGHLMFAVRRIIPNLTNNICVCLNSSSNKT